MLLWFFSLSPFFFFFFFLLFRILPSPIPLLVCPLSQYSNSFCALYVLSLCCFSFQSPVSNLTVNWTLKTLCFSQDIIYSHDSSVSVKKRYFETKFFLFFFISNIYLDRHTYIKSFHFQHFRCNFTQELK